MGCGSSTKKKDQVSKPGGGPTNPNKYKILTPSQEFSAGNKDYPTYFIGLGKAKVKTILAFDEERMA